jgi:hypothetical protein
MGTGVYCMISAMHQEADVLLCMTKTSESNEEKSQDGNELEFAPEDIVLIMPINPLGSGPREDGTTEC